MTQLVFWAVLRGLSLSGLSYVLPIFIRLPGIVCLGVPSVLDKIISSCWSSTAKWVRQRCGTGALVNRVQQGREDRPGSPQLVSPHKVLLITSDCVQDQPLVGVRNVNSSIPLRVCQVQLRHDLLHLQSWLFDHHLGIDGLLRLETDDQLIPHVVEWTEQTRRRRLQLDSDHCSSLIERLACLNDERHTCPPLILDVQLSGREGGGA
mmetsp:Transcript_5907/g.10280  ORF Transcript_5907/g.10280 Transcript_5907/m.10280 type:complete len:207 (-) Transcript_5907:1147-1767(-)